MKWLMLRRSRKSKDNMNYNKYLVHETIQKDLSEP